MDRDFGYLFPFFDRVEAAADGLTAPGATDELRRLMAGERDRWTRIQQLLNGAPGQASAQPVEPQRSTSAGRSAERLPSEFTVGPLR